MTGPHPTLSNLRPNPLWSELPLFDRTGWRRMAFGAFAESIGERAEPKDAQEEIYVGLEHLDPRCLHIRRWGKGSDVMGTKLRFQKGDIIFGRRRAYQRKLAVAEFDGICSAHALVVRARPDKVLPEFLPFLMMSDRFMNRAVEISVGSLSPTINWTTLKLEVFDLPPLDQQRRIAEILWAVDEVIQEYEAASSACRSYQTQIIEQRCLADSFQRTRLERVLRRIVAGKSLTGVNEPAGDGEFGVLKVSAVGPAGFDAAEHKRLIDAAEFISRYAVKAGDFLITRCNTKELVGRVCIVGEDHPTLMLCDKTLKLEFDEDLAKPAFIEAVLKSRPVRNQIEGFATGTGGAMKNISQDNIRSLEVPLPSLKEQEALTSEIERSIALQRGFADARDAAFKVQTSIANTIFS